VLREAFGAVAETFNLTEYNAPNEKGERSWPERVLPYHLVP
jgi:hypothetical protein